MNAFNSDFVARALRRTLGAWWLPLIVLAGSGTALASPVERLDALLGGTQTLVAEFTQTVYDEDARRIQDSGGTVHLHRPGRFRWTYRPPISQVIVADGERVWLYDQDLEQVTVRRIDAALGNTPALLLTHGGKLGEVFLTTALGDEGDLEWVELVPRSPDATFTWIRVGSDTRQIRVLRMADSFGQITELRFSDAQVNAELDNALFQFSVPDGVDVIHSDGQ